jgi:hypothetical protein
MSEYHKIQTIYKRDLSHPKKPLIIGEWSEPEFEYLANNRWEFTEKVDGTNIRVIWDQEKVTFGGRTDNAHIPGKLAARLIELFPVEKLREVLPGPAVLYGEGYGAGIQKGGGNYRLTPDFALFDVRVDQWWLRRDDVVDIATKLACDYVPVIGYGTLHDAVKMAQDGIVSAWGEYDFQAEGIVARPTVGLLARGGKRIIAKIKCRDFA